MSNAGTRAEGRRVRWLSKLGDDMPRRDEKTKAVGVRQGVYLYALINCMYIHHRWAQSASPCFIDPPQLASPFHFDAGRLGFLMFRPFFVCFLHLRFESIVQQEHMQEILWAKVWNLIFLPLAGSWYTFWVMQSIQVTNYKKSTNEALVHCYRLMTGGKAAGRRRNFRHCSSPT